MFLLCVTYRSSRWQSFTVGQVQVCEGRKAPDSAEGQPATARQVQLLQLAQPGCALQASKCCQHTLSHRRCLGVSAAWDTTGSAK